jgi:uncharacterized membrane protein HdeD (DUF308 family)
MTSEVKSPTGRSRQKSPNCLRYVQIGLGAISIILSIIILTYPDIAIYTIILLPALVLTLVELITIQ